MVYLKGNLNALLLKDPKQNNLPTWLILAKKLKFCSQSEEKLLAFRMNRGQN